MDAPRPRIEPSVLALLLESVPSRVRARLDREPNIASSWNWKGSAGGFEVAAGDEVVRIECRDGVISDAKSIGCSCLLSPKCFHIVACVSSLEIVTNEPAPNADAERNVDAAHDADATAAALIDLPKKAPSNSPSATMRETARISRDALNQVVRIGARASGTLVQSALLRSIHLCRAAELPALANALSRIVDNVRAIRSQLSTANAIDLGQDLAVALEITELILNHATFDEAVVGTSRRQYSPVPVRRLDAWFAEPVLTRSGFAGICVHFVATEGAGTDAVAADGRLFQIIDVRPGVGQLAVQGYEGGIDLGSLTESGRRLSRSALLVQGMVASHDGRLGKGKQTRWALQGDSDWSAGVIGSRFTVPVADQIARVFGPTGEGGKPWHSESPFVERRGGWDLIAFDAQLLGPSGNAIIAKVDGADRPWRLRIAIDHPQLPFRSNLELLARCPGLRLRCVGRLRPDAAGDVDLLSIGPTAKQGSESAECSTRLELPDAWRQRCHLGLDRLTEEHLLGLPRWGKELEVDSRSRLMTAGDFEPLERRWQAIVLGGYRAIASTDSETHRRDVVAFQRRNQFAGATLLNRLAETSQSMCSQSVGTERRISHIGFDRAALATAVFLRTTKRSLHQQEWKDYCAMS